MKIFKR